MKRKHQEPQDRPSSCQHKRVKTVNSFAVAHPSSPVDENQSQSSISRVSTWLDCLPRSLPVSPPVSPVRPLSDDDLGFNEMDVAASEATSASPSGGSARSTKLSLAAYRSQVLARVGICINANVTDERRRALYPPPLPPATHDAAIHNIGRSLYAGVRGLLDENLEGANELAWTELVCVAIDELMRECALLDTLKYVKSMDWRDVLKPVAYRRCLRPLVPQKRSQNTSVPDVAVPADTPPPDSHAPAPTQSRQRLTLERAPPSYQPKTPRPDICIGIRYNAFAIFDQGVWERAGVMGQEVVDYLADLQASKTTSRITDPCATPSGLRFPFLVVEMKSGCNSPMMEAENQAAVSGACALNILSRLAGKPDMDADETHTYSLTGEGPLYSLWAHCRADGKYQMVCLDVFNISIPQSTTGLVNVLARILRWGTVEHLSRVNELIIGHLGGAG